MKDGDLERKHVSRDLGQQQLDDLALADAQVAAITARMETAPASELKDLTIALSRATYWRRTLVKWIGKDEPEAKDQPAPSGIDLAAARATAGSLRSAA